MEVDMREKAKRLCRPTYPLEILELKITENMRHKLNNKTSHQRQCAHIWSFHPANLKKSWMSIFKSWKQRCSVHPERLSISSARWRQISGSIYFRKRIGSTLRFVGYCTYHQLSIHWYESIDLDMLYRHWRQNFNGLLTLRTYRYLIIDSMMTQRIFVSSSLWMRRTAMTGIITNICWENGLISWLFHLIIHPPYMNIIVLDLNISISRRNWSNYYLEYDMKQREDIWNALMRISWSFWTSL